MPKLLIAIFLLAGAALTGYIFLYPAWQEFQSLRQENLELQQESAEFDFLTQKRDALMKEVNSISKEQREALDKAIPTGAKAAEFMVDLEAITKKRGMALKRIDLAGTVEVKASAPGQPVTSRTPAAELTKKTVLEFPVGLNIAGSYEAFKELLQDVEKNLRLIDIQDISFVAPAKSDTFDFNLKIKTYFQ